MSFTVKVTHLVSVKNRERQLWQAEMINPQTVQIANYDELSLHHGWKKTLVDALCCLALTIHVVAPHLLSGLRRRWSTVAEVYQIQMNYINWGYIHIHKLLQWNELDIHIVYNILLVINTKNTWKNC